MNNWFENDEFWRAFSPVLFDRSRREAASQEVGSILDLVGGLTGMTVLDMPCGPGRHALELAKRGFSVTGVDRTELYLDEARQGALEAGVDLELVAADMRRFTRTDTYDLALNLFSSLGYFEDPDDDLILLENFYRSLTDDGVLVIDTMSKEIVAREFEERSVHRIASDLFWVEERKIRPGWDWIENHWTMIQSGQSREFKVILKLYAASELSFLLNQAGFTRIELFGNFDGSPYDSFAERLVAVARK